MLNARNVRSISCSKLNTRMMLVVSSTSWQVSTFVRILEVCLNFVCIICIMHQIDLHQIVLGSGSEHAQSAGGLRMCNRSPQWRCHRRGSHRSRIRGRHSGLISASEKVRRYCISDRIDLRIILANSVANRYWTNSANTRPTSGTSISRSSSHCSRDIPYRQQWLAISRHLLKSIHMRHFSRCSTQQTSTSNTAQLTSTGGFGPTEQTTKAT